MPKRINFSASGPEDVGVEIESGSTRLAIALFRRDGSIVRLRLAIADARRLATGLNLACDMAERDSGGYTCPRCHMTSRGAYDIQHRYCGNCHRFEDSLG